MQALKKILNENPDVTRKLRALWALHVTKGLSESDMLGLLKHESEYLRSWAIQCFQKIKMPFRRGDYSTIDMAKSDTSALVRLYIASAAQRVPVEKRWDIVDALYQHAEDKDDHNIPLMVWYAFDPLVEKDMNRAAQIAQRAKLPNALKYTARRLGEIKTPESKKVLDGLSKKQSTKHEHTDQSRK